MASRGQWLTAVVLALAGLTTGSPALADSIAPPRSYKQVTPGAKYVFIMISPMPVEEEVQRSNEETGAGIREIRRVYTQSGLYRNDGSTEPRWTVDWYAYGVEVGSDGIHLIRHGPWPGLPRYRNSSWASALDQEALSFFANGQLVRTFRIGDLVDNPAVLPRSVSHFTWLDQGYLDSGRMEYRLTTKDGNRFVLDARTGQIVSASRPVRVTAEGWAALVGVVLAVAVVAWVAWRLRHRRGW
jgi:hypothetical protein